MAEAPPPHEDPGQVPDQLRRVRLRPAGARDPRPAQGGRHLSPAPYRLTLQTATPPLRARVTSSESNISFNMFVLMLQ